MGLTEYVWNIREAEPLVGDCRLKDVGIIILTDHLGIFIKLIEDNADEFVRELKDYIVYRSSVYVESLLRKVGYICGMDLSSGGVSLPSKPKKPCAYPGCPALVTGRYCEEHAAKRNSEYEKYGRNKDTKRCYGRAWKRIRDKYAAEHPFCEKCYERGDRWRMTADPQPSGNVKISTDCWPIERRVVLRVKSQNGRREGWKIDTKL